MTAADLPVGAVVAAADRAWIKQSVSPPAWAGTPGEPVGDDYIDRVLAVGGGQVLRPHVDEEV